MKHIEHQDEVLLQIDAISTAEEIGIVIARNRTLRRGSRQPMILGDSVA